AVFGLAAAEQACRNAIFRWERMPGANVDPLVRLHTLAFLYSRLAVQLAFTGNDWDVVGPAAARATSLAPADATIHFMCGDAAALCGRWREAADTYGRAAQFEEQNDWSTVFITAMLQLAAGDDDQYKATCRDMVRRHAAVEADRALLGILCACVMGEDAVDDWNTVVEMAQKLVSRNRLNPVYATGLGAALYHAGRPDEAVKTLALATPLQAVASIAAPNMSDQIEWSRLMTAIYQALAYRELGQNDESLEARDRAWQVIVRMERSRPRYDEGFGLWAAVSVLTTAVTNMMSNGAAVAVLGPIVLKMSVVANESPIIIGYITAISSSFAYLTVVGTPACTIVYASGYLKTTDFLKVGWKMTIASTIIMLVAAKVYWPLLGV
ncbi:MAG: anion permease, partial [Proteobacteria bacterium]|nr:anion permease [Pseudomonadota bacterium]